MEDNRSNFGFGEYLPEAKEIRKQFSIENDSNKPEPFTDEKEHRQINADDPEDVARWAQEFQLSVDDLRAAMALNGNSVKQIKKYLSV